MPRVFPIPLAGTYSGSEFSLRSSISSASLPVANAVALTLGRELVSQVEYGPLIRKLIEAAQTLTQADVATVCLSDPNAFEMQQIVADEQDAQGIARIERETGAPAPAHLEQGEIFHRRGACPACRLPTRVGWCVSAAIHGEGKSLGILCAMRKDHDNPFSAGEVEALHALADWAGLAIANALKIRAVQETERDERRRIAMHLHDHAAQDVGIIGLHVEQIAAQLSEAGLDQVLAQLGAVKSISNRLMEQVRAAFAELRPQMAANDDLVAAIVGCIESFRELANIPVDLSVTGVCSLPPELHAQALHIVSEALVNVRRHAEATFVRVNLVRDARGVRIAVHDNGKGFDPKAPSASQMHLGLAIMRERARRAGGKLTIESAPGRGTRITVQLPITQH